MSAGILGIDASRRSRWLTAGMGIVLLSLALLGSPGCGCGCDEYPPDTGGECCCVFVWTVPTFFPGGNIQIVIDSQTPGLNAVITPSLFQDVQGGQDLTFEVCVDADHPLNASLILEFFPALGGGLQAGGAGPAALGGITLRYPLPCQPIFEPYPGTKIYSPDCGFPDPCCCTYVWTPEPNLQNETVQVIVDTATVGLNPVIPTQLFNVSQGQPTQFEVCVDANHPLPAQMIVTLERGKGLYAGSFALTWTDRCDPDITPGIRTPIYSTNCGDVPQCCCTFEWFRPTSAGGDITVRLEFLQVDPSLNPTVMPATRVVPPGGFAAFDVCVDVNHVLNATMGVQIVDTATNMSIAGDLVQYGEPCQVTGEKGGQTFSIFCFDDED